MAYNGYEEYSLELPVNGKICLDFKKLCKSDPAAAYKRFRARLNLYQKKTGQVLVSRKDRKGWKVIVYRVK